MAACFHSLGNYDVCTRPFGSLCLSDSRRNCEPLHASGRELASSIDPQSYRRKPMSSGGFSEDRWGHDWTSINHVNRLNSGVGVGIQRQFAVGSKLDADLHDSICACV